METGVGIMCACMPAVRSLFGLIVPKVFGSVQRSDNRTAGTHGTIGTIGTGGQRMKNGDEASFVELLPVETGDRFEVNTSKDHYSP